jgi:hypothetical protein
VGSEVNDLQREKIVERMFPDWREHLTDGKVIDHILEQLARYQILFKKCSGAGCKKVARSGLQLCTRCAIEAAEHMRSYGRSKEPGHSR